MGVISLPRTATLPFFPYESNIGGDGNISRITPLRGHAISLHPSLLMQSSGKFGCRPRVYLSPKATPRQHPSVWTKWATT